MSCAARELNAYGATPDPETASPVVSRSLRGHATLHLLIEHPEMSPPRLRPARQQLRPIQHFPHTDSGAHWRNRIRAGSRPPTPSRVVAWRALFYLLASSYAVRSARVARRALIRRTRSAPRSVNITASNRLALDLPNNTSRSSAEETVAALTLWCKQKMRVSCSVVDAPNRYCERGRR
jgi:hypothetical protein